MFVKNFPLPGFFLYIYGMPNNLINKRQKQISSNIKRVESSKIKKQCYIVRKEDTFISLDIFIVAVKGLSPISAKIFLGLFS